MLDIDPKDYQSENILSHEEALNVIKKLRDEGKKIGLASGCFDLLHPGHLTYLEEAKKNCDILIVAIAKDEYLKKTRGSGRPLFSEQLRAFMISKLKPVDIVIFDDGVFDINNVSFNVIDFIKPDVYIKGKDHTNKKDPATELSRKTVNALGKEMICTETEKLSATDIIKHIKENIPS